VIAQIDQSDYRVALAQAEAQVSSAEAGIRNIGAQISTQDAQIAASQAQVAQAQANLELSKVTWGRDKPLVNQGWATAQQGTIDVQTLKAQQAAVDSAQATLIAAQRQIDTLGAERASAKATLAQAQAQRDQAVLNLGYTTVIADQPGRVVNLTGAVGQYAQPGTNLSMFVPDEIWVVANYKETHLDHMRPGQPARIEIDAYPERDFHGHVASVQPGSGTAFSLLPPENATGNYVKIVQRVPVKIIIDNPPTDVALGPGMSVVPTVRVDPSPSLYERLKASVEQWWRRV
jgi:membrane fusion protein, multidrug efflux system